MLACTRYNRHQTNEGQYNPMTFDSTVLRFCCVTRPTRLPHSRMCHIRERIHTGLPSQKAHAGTRVTRTVDSMPVSQRESQLNARLQASASSLHDHAALG
jgi:hypothetical protein